MADQVDVALQRYRAEKHVTDTWEARVGQLVAHRSGVAAIPTAVMAASTGGSASRQGAHRAGKPTSADPQLPP